MLSPLVEMDSRVLDFQCYEVNCLISNCVVYDSGTIVVEESDNPASCRCGKSLESAGFHQK